MKRSHWFCGLCIGAVVSATGGAGWAAPVAYTDYAAFVAALPGPTTTVDFDGVAAGTILPPGSTVGGITFSYNPFPADPFNMLAVTDGNQFGGGGPLATTSGSNYLGTIGSPGGLDADLLTDDDDFTMSFAAANAIGLFVITSERPFSFPFNDSIQLTVGAATASLDINNVQQTVGSGFPVFFLGLIDDSAPFTSASLTTPNSTGAPFTYKIDDITTAVAVPVPGAFWLFGSGMVGVWGIRKRGH